MYKWYYNTPCEFSPIVMVSDGEYLTGLWFEGSRFMPETKNYDEKYISVFAETSRWLDIYFSGKNPDFTPPYKLFELTPFRKRVAEIMLSIPYGEVATYNDIAKQIASERGISIMSAQAVGGAVGHNPICIIIPCHRVVGSDGSLTGYGGGLENKKALLCCEKSAFIIDAEVCPDNKNDSTTDYIK